MQMLRRVILIITLIVGLFSSEIVRATDVGTTSWMPTAPLLISSYQTKSAGSDLTILELYNDSNDLVSLSDWTIIDTTAGHNNRTLVVSTHFTGSIEPDSHVVIASSEASIAKATYQLVGWSDTSPVATRISTLQIARVGYRSVDATIANTTESNTGTLMTRSLTTTGYSAAANPFVKNYRVPPVYPERSELFDDGLYVPPAPPSLRVVEVYAYSSDCAPYDTSVLCGDYVKLQNNGSSALDLDGLVLRTTSSSSSSTSSNTFHLSGVLQPGAYYTVWKNDDGGRISLTNSGGYVWIEDMWHLMHYDDTMTHYDSVPSANQGYAAALDEGGSWQWTSTPTPDAANVITIPVAVLAPCPEGQYRNAETNRCRKIEEVLSDLAACEEGYERNPTTNRCRKISSSATSTLTPCKEGQVRNPETNRCRSIASEVADLIPCNDGYERNPATNRCRKVQSGEVKGAEYPVQPTSESSGNTAGLWTLGAVVAVAAAYGMWEWRHELASFGSRIFRWRK